MHALTPGRRTGYRSCDVTNLSFTCRNSSPGAHAVIPCNETPSGVEFVMSIATTSAERSFLGHRIVCAKFRSTVRRITVPWSVVQKDCCTQRNSRNEVPSDTPLLWRTSTISTRSVAAAPSPPVSELHRLQVLPPNSLSPGRVACGMNVTFLSVV